MAGHLANDETIWEDPPASLIQFRDSKNRERAVSADWFQEPKLTRLLQESKERNGKVLQWAGLAELALRLEYEDQQEELKPKEPDPVDTSWELTAASEEEYQTLLDILMRQAVKEKKQEPVQEETDIQDWF